MRLDAYLAQKLPWRSRTNVQELLRERRITVSGESRKRAFRVRPGDEIVIPLDALFFGFSANDVATLANAAATGPLNCVPAPQPDSARRAREKQQHRHVPSNTRHLVHFRAGREADAIAALNRAAALREGFWEAYYLYSP